MAFQRDMSLDLSKPVPRVLDKRAADRAKETVYRKTCALVTLRDGSRCRVCGGRGNHHHHIVYRSHGGKDVVNNLLLTCTDCHKDIHAKVTLVTFNPNNPAGTIRFSRNMQWDKR